MASAVLGRETAAVKKNKKTKKKAGIGSRLLTIILTGVLIVGIGLLLYPTFANWWNSTRQTKVLDQYMAELAEIDQEEANRLIDEAKEYNAKMAGLGIMWQLSDEQKKEYNSKLNYLNDGVMGYIEINSLDIMLPIYHGTEESELVKGIGHLDSTSLPIGAATFDDDLGIVTDPEDGAHCVISGHRGLPSSRLFTDLDKMVVGDTFGLNIYNNILIYEVDQIRVVLPEDLSELQLIKGEDYCTLVTCTPYGINTHRLLVRGKRVSTKDAERFIYRIQGNARQIRPAAVAAILAAPIIALLFLAVMIDPVGRRRAKALKRIEAEYGKFMDAVNVNTDDWK